MKSASNIIFYYYMQGLTLTPANPPNAGGFQQWRVIRSIPLATVAGWILYSLQ